MGIPVHHQPGHGAAERDRRADCEAAAARDRMVMQRALVRMIQQPPGKIGPRQVPGERPRGKESGDSEPPDQGPHHGILIVAVSPRLHRRAGGGIRSLRGGRR